MKKTNSPKKQRIKRFCNYGFLFAALFGVSAVTTYFLAPTKRASMNGLANNDGGDSSSTNQMTPAQNLTANLSNMGGMSAVVNSFSATIKNPLSTTSSPKGDIALSLKNTSLQLAINGWPDVAIDLKTTVCYEGIEKPIALAYVDSNIYLSALGLKYKTTTETGTDFFDSMITLFNLANMPSPDLSGMDTSSMSSMMDKMTSTGNTETGFVYTLPLNDDGSQSITMTSDGKYNLTGVKTSGISINGNSLAFDVSIDTLKSFDVSTFVPSDANTAYLDIYNSYALIKRVTDLVRTPTFGVNIGVSMEKSVTEGATTNVYQVASVSGSANLDVTANNYQGALTVEAPSSKTLKSDVASLSEDKKTKQTVSANYVKSGDDGKVFVSYNDAMKLKMTTSVANNLFKKIQTDFPVKDTSSMTKLFDFVTDSTVMKELADGKFASAINMLDDFTIGNNTLTATLHLKNLGLGDNSSVVVTLDGNETSSSLAKIEANHIVMSAYEMNATFSMADYVKPTLAEDAYQTLDNTPTIYDQFLALSKDTTAAVDLNGSVMKYDTSANAVTKNGVRFTGNTEFDANQDTTKDTHGKSGTGSAEITQIKDGTDFQTHHVGIDVRGTDKMLFRYTTGTVNSESKYLNGKFEISTLNGIIDLVKKLMNSTDARYTKFLDPLKEQSATMVLGKIMAGDYEELLRTKVLDKVSVASDAIVVVVDKALLSSTTNIELTLGLESGKVKSVAINEFVIEGMDINVTLTLGTYDVAKLATLPDDVTYLDFSQIEVLMAFGITTSEQSYFHLTASGTVSLGKADLISLKMDFHITVNGEVVKVVGTTTLPLVPFVNGTSPLWLAGGTRTVKFYYEPGYCYLNGHDDYSISTRLDTSDAIKVKDTYFASNLMKYLLKDYLQVTDSIYSQITETKSDSSKPVSYEKVLTDFQYANTTGTAPSWDLSIDTGVLANNSMLGLLQVHISGNDADASDGVLDGYLNKMNVTFAINAGITITIKLNAVLENPGSADTEFPSTILSDYNKYIADHASETVEGA